ncbi:MAG: 30S ribosomal protein S16, partial [Bacteroidota bacterium]
MPVKLRLKRQGRKKAAHYAIVAADSRSPRDGRHIEKVGTYNPMTHPARLYVDEDKAIKWLQDGAQPTNTVRNLLRHAGVTVKFALIKQGKSEEQIADIYGRW